MPKSRKSQGKLAKERSPAFENVKGQLGYCGLWCGSCLVGNGTLNELAGKCGKAIADYGVNEWGPKGIDYNGVLKGLDVVSSMEPCQGCLKGGGRTDCEIRACALERNLTECVDCDMHEACKNSAIIRHMREGALRVGMMVKEKQGDRAKALEKWVAETDDG